MTDDEFWCRTCDAVTHELDDRGRPAGWYRLLLNTPGPATRYDISPGFYCSRNCVVHAAMRPFGLSRPDVAAWLGVA